MFIITLSTDNAAFEDNAEAETALILRKIAERILDGEDSGTVKDSNGNTVGGFKLDPTLAGPPSIVCNNCDGGNNIEAPNAVWA